MPAHAEFATALTIRERVLNDSLLLSYHAGTISHRMAGPIPDNPPDVIVDFFLEAPQVQCVGSDPERFNVLLSGWGDMLIVWNGLRQRRNVRWEMQLLIHPRFVLDGSELALRPQSEDETLERWQFDVLSGAPYSPDVDLYLRGGIFRNRLQLALRTAISLGLLNIRPIDVSFLGSIVESAAMETAARVVDGAIVIGLNITSGSIVTAGNVQLLSDFARNNDIAVVTNPAVVPVTLQDAEQEVRNEVAKEGATLEHPLSMTVEEGRFRVSGRASRSEGAVNFSFSILPMMFENRPGAFLPTRKRTIVVKRRSWPVLKFEVADILVDVDRSSWVILVEVLSVLISGAVIPLIVEDLVRGIAAQVAFRVKNRPMEAPLPRVRRLEPVVDGDPAVRLKIEEFEIHNDGVFTGITLRPEIKPPMLIGLTTIPANATSSPLKYEVRLPFQLLPDDPSLRIRWTIVDLSSGTTLINDDNLATGRLEFEFVPASLGAGQSRLGIMCRVYRVLGPQITDFLNDGIRLDVRDPLPPDPYVRWRYYIKNPQVRFDEDSKQYTYLGDLVVSRWSAIHRTDRPCRMANRRSRYFYSVEFLNELPFPLNDITSVIRRAQLCDYCFFGGPGGSLPSL